VIAGFLYPAISGDRSESTLKAPAMSDA
jgi:hypothetical protein